ncbi:polyprenyl diphosphate synthase [Nocardia aurantiaca]|uniref:Isoprenyl transferase n=1 Tax=Nocardia aurantiaca TaxID=2675850 RepID=A0A6I3L3B5_9NOCA|nr:polyprenyl diphosphate synthase [Nocardia aurantiaca]MTE16812.1 di-trans,poly-cis-decaprenylcistransferase [Nocardia aurantiaca]
MRISDPIYGLYARHLRRQITGGPVPAHIGLIMDGNRRWAQQMGMDNPSLGHQYGAEHSERVLSWCKNAGIRHVTVFICSVENLSSRSTSELTFLMQVLEQLVTDRLTQPNAHWQVHIAGDLDLLPTSTARVLEQGVEVTSAVKTGFHLTLAVGYGGRQEIVEALRRLLSEHANAGRGLADLAEDLTIDDIARHLYTAGQPEPDLVIRTSGEQRLSNFLLWQSAYAELYFCDAYWPAVREVDFLRALRNFATRQRRYGA